MERKQGLWLWTFKQTAEVESDLTLPPRTWALARCQGAARRTTMLYDLGLTMFLRSFAFLRQRWAWALPDSHNVIQVSFLILLAIGVWLWATRGIIMGISHVQNRKLLTMGYHMLTVNCCSFLYQIPESVSAFVITQFVWVGINHNEMNTGIPLFFPSWLLAFFNERGLLESRDCFCSFTCKKKF